MSVLAIFGAPACRGPGALEFLRVLAALAACGRSVRLVETDGARGALAADDLEAEAERILEGLAGLGVLPEAPGDGAIAHAAAAARGLLVLGPPARAGRPDLLVAGEGDGPGDWARAGQVVPASRAT